MEDRMTGDKMTSGETVEGRIIGFMEGNLNVSRSTLALSGDIARAAGLIVECLKGDGKILAMGNGGSASQASHFAGELVGRYRKDRKGLPCIALTTDTSVITAVGNDYGFDRIFERQVEALAKKGDVIIGLSTSGKSENVIKALEKGREIGCRLVTLTGKDGGVMRNADVNISIASENTPRVQEMHLMILHIICELVEVNSE